MTLATWSHILSGSLELKRMKVLFWIKILLRPFLFPGLVQLVFVWLELRARIPTCLNGLRTILVRKGTLKLVRALSAVAQHYNAGQEPPTAVCGWHWLGCSRSWQLKVIATSSFLGMFRLVTEVENFWNHTLFCLCDTAYFGHQNFDERSRASNAHRWERSARHCQKPAASDMRLNDFCKCGLYGAILEMKYCSHTISLCTQLLRVVKRPRLTCMWHAQTFKDAIRISFSARR